MHCLRDSRKLSVCNPEAHIKRNCLFAQTDERNRRFWFRLDGINLFESFHDLLVRFVLDELFLRQLHDDYGTALTLERVVDHNAAKNERIWHAHLFATDQAQLGGTDLY